MAYIYETHFSLEYPVNDFDAAKDWLTKTSTELRDILAFHIQCDKDENHIDNFGPNVQSISYQLEDTDSGKIQITTDIPLKQNQLVYLSNWLTGQNADGIGESFEQRPFALWHDNGYGDYEEGDYEEYCDEEPIMASFDWESNSYPLALVSKSPTLTAADLEFAEANTEMTK